MDVKKREKTGRDMDGESERRRERVVERGRERKRERERDSRNPTLFLTFKKSKSLLL